MTRDDGIRLIVMVDTYIDTNDQRIHLDVIELGYRAAFDLYHLDDVMYGGWF